MIDATVLGQSVESFSGTIAISLASQSKYAWRLCVNAQTPFYGSSLAVPTYAGMVRYLEAVRCALGFSGASFKLSGSRISLPSSLAPRRRDDYNDGNQASATTFASIQE